MLDHNTVKAALSALVKLYAGLDRPSRRRAGPAADGAVEAEPVDSTATQLRAQRDSYLSRYDLQVRAAGRAPSTRR